MALHIMKLTDIRRKILESLVNKEDASYDCERILECVYSLDRTSVLLKLQENFEYKSLVDDLIRKRNSGMPLEYILGKTFFYGRPFSVTPACLIPQSDTEIIIEQALKAIPSGGNVIDLGTGSGCIAVTIACETGANVLAVDISEEALRIAKQNAAKNEVAKKITFLQSDILSSDSHWDGKKFDLIVSNPPYVETGVISSLSPEVRNEPIIALDGGKDGLLFYRNLIPKFGYHLTESGVVILEIGYNQASSVCQIFTENGFLSKVYKDYGGNDRCVVAKAGK